MGQIANQMLIEAVFKLKEKLKEKKAEKNAAGVPLQAGSWTGCVYTVFFRVHCISEAGALAYADRKHTGAADISRSSALYPHYVLYEAYDDGFGMYCELYAGYGKCQVSPCRDSGGLNWVHMISC